MQHISRRTVLGLGGMSVVYTQFAVAAGSAERQVLLSAASDPDGGHWIVGLQLENTRATDVFRAALPDRAHHIAVDEARGIYIVVARRPGTWLQPGDLATGQLLPAARVPDDRRLAGHGVFSADGIYFYTTEIDRHAMADDDGLVVEWRVAGTGAAAGLQRQREFPTGGIGPHELLLSPDGETLIVANGGIRTHPDNERENLNLDTMVPSLVYIDRHSGALLEQHFLPAEYHQAGIRHLDVNADGLVVLAMQFEGEPFMDVPLLATHRRGEPLRLLHAPSTVQPQMQQYIGSVRFDQGGRFFAASCPRGNLLTFWDAENGSFLHSLRARDNCGVCAVAGGFVYSTGRGRLGHIDLAQDGLREIDVAPSLARLFWDNHLSARGQG